MRSHTKTTELTLPKQEIINYLKKAPLEKIQLGIVVQSEGDVPPSKCPVKNYFFSKEISDAEKEFYVLAKLPLDDAKLIEKISPHISLKEDRIDHHGPHEFFHQSLITAGQVIIPAGFLAYLLYKAGDTKAMTTVVMSTLCGFSIADSLLTIKRNYFSP